MATKKAVKRLRRKAADVDPIMITIQGYKSIFRRITLPIKPLTVLAGSNSSGKSSFMQPLLLMKQTLEAPYDPGPLMISGPNIRFTAASQFLSTDISGNPVQDLYVGLSHSGRSSEVHFHKATEKPIDLKSQKMSDGKAEISLVANKEFKFGDLPKAMREAMEMYVPMVQQRPLVPVRNRCFLDIGVKFGPRPSDVYLLGAPKQVMGDFTDVLRSMIYLPGLRGNPSRTYQVSTVSDTFPGAFQNYAASLINHWGDRESQELVTLNTYLQELKIATRISAKKVDETQVELRVDRLGSHDKSDVSIADVGMAVSQVLPLLVALAAAKRGQLIFIEQPELHLHPKAQVALAKIVCGAVERGINLVLETHSSLLLLGIQTCIAEKVIDHTNVALHWFKRDLRGVTCVDSAQLDEKGAFGTWPQDFADVSLAAEDEYLSAAEAATSR